MHKNGEYTSRSLVAVDGAAPSVERIVPRFWNTDGTFYSDQTSGSEGLTATDRRGQGKWNLCG